VCLRLPCSAAALAIVLGLLVPTTAAHARGGPGLKVTPRISRADGHVVVELLVVSTAGLRCNGSVQHAGEVMHLPPLTIDRDNGRLWRWSLARGVPSGRWAGGFGCRGGGDSWEAHRKFSTGAGPHGAWRPRVLAAPGSLTDAGYRPQNSPGGRGGSGSEHLIDPSAFNPYAPGECTWWVWSKRPDLPFFPGTAGDAANWIRSARARRIPTGNVPVVGAVAVWAALQRGAGEFGHVAYVEAVRGDTIVVSETHWGRSQHIHRRTTAWRGLRFVYGGPAGDGPGSPGLVAAAPPLRAPPNTFPYRVYHTCANGHCGLPVRTGPGNAFPVSRQLPDGTEVDIVCQTRGDAVTGIDGSSSNVWDELADGTFVADFFVNTPGTQGSFSPPIPVCANPAPGPPVAFYVFQVYHTCASGHCGLAERTGPGFSAYPAIDWLADGTNVDIVCQTVGEPVTGIDGSTSNVWDHLTNGDYVSDYYVNTPGTLGAFSPPIPRCSGA